MSNCKEDTDDGDNEEIIKVNPFIGTWKSIESGYHDVFTANTITVYDTDKKIFWKATYTYDDTNITVVVDKDLSNQEVIYTVEAEKGLIPYFFQDGYLIFYGVQLEKCNYDFTP